MRLRSYTSVFGLLGVLATGLVGCPGSTGLSGGDDPCYQAMAIKCERISACVGAAALASLGYASVSDCTKGLGDANCTLAQPACDPGTNCLDSLRAQSCADFSSGVQPSACAYSCIPGGEGTGGSGGDGTYGGEGGNLGGWGGNVGTGLSTGGSGAGGSGSSGLSAVAACNEAIAAICEQTSYCGGALALADLGYSSTADCVQGLQTANCTSQAGCGPGETFDLDQATKCIDGFRAESCADFSSGVEPAACSLVCGRGGIGGVSGYGGWGGDVGGQGGWGGDVGGQGGWGGDVGGQGGWGGDVGGQGGWGGDVGGQGGWGGWPWS
jgi:hypothetical protein